MKKIIIISTVVLALVLAGCQNPFAVTGGCFPEKFKSVAVQPSCLKVYSGCAGDLEVSNSCNKDFIVNDYNLGLLAQISYVPRVNSKNLFGGINLDKSNDECDYLKVAAEMKDGKTASKKFNCKNLYLPKGYITQIMSPVSHLIIKNAEISIDVQYEYEDQPPEEETDINGARIANPASVNCEQKGGKVEIKTAADGSQSGICKFPDGSQCEEWAFFRGECNKAKTDIEIPKTQEACETQGGTWRPMMPQNYPLCIIKFSDAGKPCISSNECQGDCVITKISEIGSKTGKCKEDNDNLGCFSEIGADNITCRIGDIWFQCGKTPSDNEITNSECQRLLKLQE